MSQCFDSDKELKSQAAYFVVGLFWEAQVIIKLCNIYIDIVYFNACTLLFTVEGLYRYTFFIMQIIFVESSLLVIMIM